MIAAAVVFASTGGAAFGAALGVRLAGISRRRPRNKEARLPVQSDVGPASPIGTRDNESVTCDKPLRDIDPAALRDAKARLALRILARRPAQP